MARSPEPNALPARDEGAGRWGTFAGLLAVTLAVSATFSGIASREPRPEGPLAVEVSSVSIDPSRASGGRVGALRFLGGLWLRSVDSRFGGLSDLRVSADGTALRAVTDCGSGLTARLRYDGEGRLAGLDEARIVALRGLDGRPLGARERDAESLVASGSSLAVAFEGKDRILAYSADPPFSGAARLMPSPGGLRACGSNAGLETMAQLDDGRLLLVCEGRRHASLDVPAWVGGGGRWTERSYPLRFAGGWAGVPFRPTSAAPLPGGDALVLERRFPPIAARVVRLTREDLDGTGPLHPREIARLEPPLTVSNFEGIETRWDRGRTLVYLVSDDNHCAKVGSLRGPALQRTLLFLFSLES